jgi:prepilin-type N-terminal cleavage/methylation domain-containing protein
MPPRTGFTLLELIVVVAILGITLAVATPAFIAMRPAVNASEARAIDDARRAAIRRGEPMTLVIDTTGRWSLRSDATPDSQPVLTATLDRPPARLLRLRISPLGACVPDALGADAWDPMRCAPERRARSAR